MRVGAVGERRLQRGVGGRVDCSPGASDTTELHACWSSWATLLLCSTPGAFTQIALRFIWTKRFLTVSSERLRSAMSALPRAIAEKAERSGSNTTLEMSVWC